MQANAHTKTFTTSKANSRFSEMRMSLHILATITCLLTILVGSVSCLHIATHQQPACSHCAKHEPPSKTTPSCCNPDHQIQTALVSAEVQQPTQLSATIAPLLPNLTPQFLAPSLTPLSASPPRPPRIALRI